MERWTARGIAFGSHTATHPRLSWLDQTQLIDELWRSRAAIETALGAAPTAIAYPFGAVAAREARAAARAGYALGFRVGGHWAGDALRIPRVPVHSWSPRIPAVGALGAVERLVSTVAGRCSLGTTLWRRLTNAAAG